MYECTIFSYICVLIFSYYLLISVFLSFFIDSDHFIFFKMIILNSELNERRIFDAFKGWISGEFIYKDALKIVFILKGTPPAYKRSSSSLGVMGIFYLSERRAVYFGHKSIVHACDASEWVGMHSVCIKRHWPPLASQTPFPLLQQPSPAATNPFRCSGTSTLLYRWTCIVSSSTDSVTTYLRLQGANAVEIIIRV